MAQHEYDPSRVEFLYGGVAVSGYAEDSMITIEESGPLYTHKQGVKGDVSRSKNLARTLLVTVHLMNTSRSNAMFSAAVEAGLATDGGADIVPVLMRDENGGSTMAGDTAWIEERPKPVRGKEATVNEWKIRVAPEYKWLELGT